jgi:hypothetical protein
MEIKTIDINALEWFDKVNGNSYFSATIIINYGLKAKYSKAIDSHCMITQFSETVIKLSFQYGYGEHYIDMANQKLIKLGYVNTIREGNGSYNPLWRYCKENNIILRTNKKANCKKSELIH